MTRLISALVFVPAILTAQTAVPAFGSMQGIVLDSLHNEPLRGAVVSVAGLNAISTSDSLGRFAFNGLKPGHYDIHAGHPLADSIGIVIEARNIAVAAGGDYRVALAVPDKETLRRIFCPEAAAGTEHGVIRGKIQSVDSNEPTAGADVTLTWFNISSNASGIHVIPGKAVTKTDEMGYYTFCGLPVYFEASVTATKGSAETGLITVSVAGGGYWNCIATVVVIRAAIIEPRRAQLVA